MNHTIADEQEEIGLTYSLSKKYWEQGLAVEIRQFAIKSAFNLLKLDNIVCFAAEINKQSLRVIDKLGFEYEKQFVCKNVPHKLFRLTNK